MIRKLRSVFLVGMLLLASVAGPGAGTAVAATNECSTLDGFIYDVLTFQPFDMGDDAADNPCSTRYQVDQAITEMEEADTNQTKVDIYSAWTAQKATVDTWKVSMDNGLQDSESVAWMKAQVAVAEAYENGSTKAEARIAAREAIADYYAVRQKNILTQWNNTAVSADSINDREEMESIDSNFVAMNVSSTVHPNVFTNGTQSVTLTNGNTSDAIVLAMNNTGSTFNNVPFDGLDSADTLFVKAPNSNYDRSVMRLAPWYETWSTIETKNDNLQTEADTFVNNTWADYDAGVINSSDVISANTAMFEYGTRSGNETEGLYNSVGALALMGFDTPNMTNAGTMTVTYENRQYTGLLLARNAPNGTWETGKTYDASNITGPVFVARTDGGKTDIDGEFVINEMTAKDGSELNSTETTRYAYKTANTTELLEMQEQLTTLRQEIEDREASIGGGGGGGGVENAEMVLLGAVAVLAAIVLIRN